LSLTDYGIFICEFISDVPSNWTELSSVLDDSMEEC
jgi:hypothetical protein